MSDRIRQAFEAADQDLFSLEPSLYTRGTESRYDDMAVQCRWETWLSSRRVALEEAAGLCKRNELGVTAGGSFADGMRSMARHLDSAIRREAQ